MKYSGQLRKRTLAGEWVTGTFLNLGSALTVEIAGNSGLDWLLIDHEHGPGGEETLVNQLLAASATPATPIVRIAANEPPRFKRVLDVGAQGVMVPYISTRAEAEAALSALRYPPRGTRGVAKSPRATGYSIDFEEYYTHAHEWLLLAAQVETPASVENAAEIASLDGVDVLFIGPTDLTYNLGIRDQFDHPVYIEAQKKVVAAAKNAGKAAGILINNPAFVDRCRTLGFTFVALGSDGSAVTTGLRQFASTLRTAGRA